MSYFKAKVGNRPTKPEVSSTKSTKSTELTGKKPVSTTQPEAKSYFGTKLPTRSGRENQVKPATQPSDLAKAQPLNPESQIPTPTCPLCCSDLVQKDGLYHCQGRCGGHWLQEASGRLVDLTALPFGICRCCHPPRALVCGEGGALCPQTQAAYLLLPTGPAPMSQIAPHGVCYCCSPPMPLIRQDDYLVCQLKPQEHYQLQDGQLRRLTNPTTNPAETLAAIDEALRQNNANLTVYGLFDL